MKLTHEFLTDIIKHMKLSLVDGVCHGYAIMLSQFVCQGKEDEFFYLLNQISNFNNPDKLLQAYSINRNQISRLRAFLEEIALYQNPFFFKHLLGERYSQLDIGKISAKRSSLNSFLSPYAIKQVPLEVVYKKAVILAQMELITYLGDLEVLLKQESSIPIAILLSNHAHTILIKYDVITGKWVNRDVEFLKNAEYQQHRYSIPKLADSIFHSFGDKTVNFLTEYTGFVLSLVVNHKNVPRLRFHLREARLRIPTFEVLIRRKTTKQVDLLMLSEANDCDEYFVILSRNDVNPNVKLNGHTLLHRACINLSLDKVRALLSHPGINPNELNDSGETPLHIVCMSGDLSFAKALLSHPKIEPNKINAEGLTPLHKACIFGHVDIVRLLLLHREVNPNELSKVSSTPCIYKGFDHAGFVSITPLDCSCIYGHIHIVKVLLTHPKTSSQIRGNDGLSSLDRARIGGFVDIEKELLDHQSQMYSAPKRQKIEHIK